MRYDAVEFEGMPKALGPWTQGVRVGNLVFTAGMTALNDRGEIVGRGDIKAQTRQTLENVRMVLEAAGSSLDDVVKVTAWLTDLRNYGGYNEVYAEYFGPRFPPRATLQSPGLVPLEGLMVEIEAIAVVPES